MSGFKISIIAPAYNEAQNLKLLFNEITAVCEKENYDAEIIFVDDGSTDDTPQTLARLAPLKYIRLTKNAGQSAALDAGIKAAKNDFIALLDADGQNDPADIPAMLAYLLKNNLDLVCGWRKKRRDNFSKRFLSRGAYVLRQILINDKIHDSGCTLKVFRRRCFDDLTLTDGMHRFIPAMLIMRGFKVGEIEVRHRPRTRGVTKYNWRRIIKGFKDMLRLSFLRFSGKAFLTETALYIAAGLATTAVNLGLFHLFLLTAGYKAANLGAVVIAKIFAYAVNKKFVFKAQSATKKDAAREAGRFFAATVFTGLVDYLGLILLVEAFGAGVIISKYALAFLVIILNYLMRKIYVFKGSGK